MYDSTKVNRRYRRYVVYDSTKVNRRQRGTSIDSTKVNCESESEVKVKVKVKKKSDDFFVL